MRIGQIGMRGVSGDILIRYRRGGFGILVGLRERKDCKFKSGLRKDI